MPCHTRRVAHLTSHPYLLCADWCWIRCYDRLGVLRYARDTSTSLGDRDGAWSTWGDVAWGQWHGSRDGAWGSWDDGAWGGWESESQAGTLDGAWGSWHNGSWSAWVPGPAPYEYDWRLTPSITGIAPSQISSARTTRVTITGNFSTFDATSCDATMRFISPSGLFRECENLELVGNTATCLLVRGKPFPYTEQRRMLPWLRLCTASGHEVVAHPEPDCCSPAPYYGRVDLALRIEATAPHEGSLAGGTRITIDGAGFAPIDAKIVRSALTFNYLDSMTVVNITTDHKTLPCSIIQASFTQIVCQTPMLEASARATSTMAFTGRYIYHGEPGRNGRVAVSINDITAEGCGADPNAWVPPPLGEPAYPARDPAVAPLGPTCEAVSTDGGVGVWGYRYQYRMEPGGAVPEAVNIHDGIVFNVRARRDAQVVISPINRSVSGAQGDIEMYEITLGGWQNSQSAIARTKMGTSQRTVQSELLLAPYGGSDFWVRLTEHPTVPVTATIEVGSGCTVGAGVFMEWTDPLHTARDSWYFGVATVDTPGEWVHCMDPDDMPIGTCGTTGPTEPPFTTTTPFYNLSYVDNETDFKCEFDYNEHSTPTLAALSTNNLTDATVITITGARLTIDGSAAPEVFIGLYECVVSAFTESEVTCEAPAMTAGAYHVRVWVPGLGFAAHPAGGHELEFVMYSILEFTTLSPRVGSTAGGRTVTITGKGFSAEHCSDCSTGVGPCIDTTRDVQTGMSVQACEPFADFAGRACRTGLTRCLKHGNNVTIGNEQAHVIDATYDQLIVVTPVKGIGWNATTDRQEAAGDDDDFRGVMISVETQQEPRHHMFGQLDGDASSHRYTDWTVDALDIVESTMTEYFRSLTSGYHDPEDGAFVLPAVYYASNGFCDDAALCEFEYAVASTPTVTSVTPDSGEMGDTIVIAGTGFGTDGSAVDILIGDEFCAVVSVTDIEISCTVGATPAGTHQVYVTNQALGTAAAPGMTFASTLTVTSIDQATGSYGGGHEIVIAGKGFGCDKSQHSDCGTGRRARARRDGAWGGWVIYEYGDATATQADIGTTIKLCDQPCIVTDTSYTSVTCTTPAINSPARIAAFGGQESAVLAGEIFSSTQLGTVIYGAAFDGDYETSFEDAEAQCYTGIDLGPQGGSLITKVRWFPSHQQTDTTVGGTFDVSNDGFAWTTIYTITSAHEGWNCAGVNNDNPHDAPTCALPAQPAPVRYVRYHSAAKRCSLAFLEFSGIAASPDGVCGVAVEIQATLSHASHGPVATNRSVTHSEFTNIASYSYSTAQTPEVTAIEPRFGSSLGGTSVTLTGAGLPTTIATAMVELNDRDCAVTAVSDDGSSVTCTTSPRADFRPLSVAAWDSSGVGQSVNNRTVYYRYLDRWSETSTWLNDEPPVFNDTVVIPRDQTILIDVPLPRLYLVLIQGFVMFDPSAPTDLNLDATYILVYGGALQAGTHDEPFLNKLNITLHGDRYTDMEIPNFGVKVLAVADRGGLSESSFANGEGHEVPDSQRGIIDIHGRPRLQTWTTLSVDADLGTDIITLTDAVDWEVGERLIITGTILDENEGDTNDLKADMPPPCMFEANANTTSEEVEVAEVISPTQLRITAPLAWNHPSSIETSPGGAVYDFRAQVGLLSRNIILGGDEGSEEQMFGSHTIAVHGGNLRVENTEVTRCGQAANLGRYCLHFHKAGYQPGGPQMGWKGSYFIGNSIHHGFQRATTIHSTTHTTVSDNVAYHIMGHNYFVEDGDEEYVNIERNLAVDTHTSPFSLFSDCQAASFWTATPKNRWVGNVAANSHGHGFWFELDAGAAGDFTHHPTIEMANNIFHDNNLRGWFIAPKYLPDTPQYFRNNTYYRNLLDGVFYGVGGDTHHIGDKFSSNSGTADLLWWFFPSRESSRWIPNLKDVHFHGGNWHPKGPPVNDGGGALFAPNQEFFLVDGAEFWNYNDDAAAISQCFDCCGYRSRQSAFTTRFARLSFPDTARRTTFACPAKQIYFDLDGSLTGTGVPGGTVTAFLKFNVWEECPQDTTGTFEYGIVCNSSVRVRKLSIPSFVGPKRTEPRELMMKDLFIKKSRMVQPKGFEVSFPYNGDGVDATKFEKITALRNIADFLGLEHRHVAENQNADADRNGVPVFNVVIGGFLDEYSQLDPKLQSRSLAAHEYICQTGTRTELHMAWDTCASPGGMCNCQTQYMRYGYHYQWRHINTSGSGTSLPCTSESFDDIGDHLHSEVSWRGAEMNADGAGRGTGSGGSRQTLATCQCLRANSIRKDTYAFNFSGIASVFGTTPVYCDTPAANTDTAQQGRRRRQFVLTDGGATILSGSESPTASSPTTSPTRAPSRCPGEHSGSIMCQEPTPITIEHECEFTPARLAQLAALANTSESTDDELLVDDSDCYVRTCGQVPLDGVAGQGRTSEPSFLACQERCASTGGCEYWSWWPDGGCHLTSGANGRASFQTGCDYIISGRAICREEHAGEPHFTSLGQGTNCASSQDGGWHSEGWPKLYRSQWIHTVSGPQSVMTNPAHRRWQTGGIPVCQDYDTLAHT